MSRDATGLWSGWATERIRCPFCAAPPGTPCADAETAENRTHQSRVESYCETYALIEAALRRDDELNEEPRAEAELRLSQAVVEGRRELCRRELETKQAVIELYGGVLSRLFPEVRASGDALIHAQRIVGQVNKLIEARKGREELRRTLLVIEAARAQRRETLKAREKVLEVFEEERGAVPALTTEQAELVTQCVLHVAMVPVTVAGGRSPAPHLLEVLSRPPRS